MAEYKEIMCSSFINRMKESLFTLRSYSIRLTANPYSGCIHNCAWCYARYIHKFNTRYDSDVKPADFNKKVFVKVNAPEILAKELQLIQKKNFLYEYCDLSTITDAYQVCERKYRITRHCLEIFMKYNFPVTVLTRSNVILDDLDIWKNLAQKNIGVVGISITRPTTLDFKLKNVLEPASPSTEDLLQVLKVLNINKIPTFVFVNPIVPFLTDQKEVMTQLLTEIAATGCKVIFLGVMKLNLLTWSFFKERIREYDEFLIHAFEELYFKQGVKEFGRSWQPSFSYRRSLYERARDICKGLNIGFSCEGGLYELWLNDWCNVENPYRYPTGYNLWELLKINKTTAQSFDEFKSNLKKQFPLLSVKYFQALEKFWNERLLFADLPGIKSVQDEKLVKYYYD